MTDLTAIESNGEFSECICDYLSKNKCEVIIETGLYHGTGSTRIISTLIRGLKMTEAEFYSIECNEESIEIAKKYLTEEGLIDYVEILGGLSIPKEMLPSEEEIKKIILRATEQGLVKLDHEQDPENGYKYYKKETGLFADDDLLGKLIRRKNGQIDFLLLDSGGHMGNLEFEYAITLINSPCAIALDDTRHIKHYRCLDRMKKDKRFRILNDNAEKFGSALAIFNP